MGGNWNYHVRHWSGKVKKSTRSMDNRLLAVIEKKVPMSLYLMQKDIFYLRNYNLLWISGCFGLNILVMCYRQFYWSKVEDNCGYLGESSPTVLSLSSTISKICGCIPLKKRNGRRSSKLKTTFISLSLSYNCSLHYKSIQAHIFCICFFIHICGEMIKLSS